MSKLPKDMLLYPDGQPRVMNVDNRIGGEINGVPYRVEIRGDFANCSFIDPRDRLARRMMQPHFAALGIMIACLEVAEGRSFDAPVMGLRPRPDGTRTIDGY